MDGEDEIYDARVGGFNLMGLLLAFSLVATFIFLLYWLWNWTCPAACCPEEEIDRGPNHHNQVTVTQRPVVPLYAFELEPGTVVLQSADGEIFRILREYDSVGRTGRGSPPLYSSVATHPSTASANEPHCVPPFTRVHFQTRPSAPAYDANCNSYSSGGRNRDGNNPNTQYASENEAFLHDGPWAPLSATDR